MRNRCVDFKQLIISAAADVSAVSRECFCNGAFPFGNVRRILHTPAP